MHQDTWQLQEAKAKLSAMLKAAQSRPQWITLHGEEAGVLLSAKTYQKLTHNKKRSKKTSGKMTIGKFLRQSPLYGAGIELDISRPHVPGDQRDIRFDDTDNA